MKFVSKEKKVLIISNECFSKTNSNGRTLMNLFGEFSPNKLAQFYLYGNPDFDVCENYYCVSDYDALNSLKHLRKQRKSGLVQRNVDRSLNDAPSVSKNSEHKIKRNCRNNYIRHLVWSTRLWWNKDFDLFLNRFEPNVVLLQAGDCPFMYAIACRIAKKYHASLMMFNTENYVLKKKLYSKASQYSLWHMLLKHSLKRQYAKFMKHTSFCIYSTEYLEESYQRAYPHPEKSCSMYTTSEFTPLQDESSNTFHVLYCGNLGVGRDDPLNEFAKALSCADENAILDIYGKFPDEESRKKVCDNSNVVYHGFVDYSEIPAIMSHSSMLLHCENNNRLENLKGAFSTKIADSLASGRPFMVYASAEYPFVKYLKKNNCAHIVAEQSNLEEIIKKCIADKEYLYQYVSHARNVADQNHNIKMQCKKMKAIIDNL